MSDTETTTARPLDGKVAIITGASRGIGAAVARAFSDAGAAVALAARDQNALADLADELTATGGQALAVPTDVSDADAVARLVEQTVDAFGRLDVACNDAAGGGHRPTLLADVLVEDFDSSYVEGGERETLRALLQYQRDSVLRKVAGVDEDAARRPVVGSGTTLLWLVKHLARAETLWIVRRFAGQDVEVPDDRLEPDDSLESAIGAYQETWRRADTIIAGALLEQSCRDVGDEEPVNLRWVLMHLLEETARHAGHADILRELIDGHTGR